MARNILIDLELKKQPYAVMISRQALISAPSYSKDVYWVLSIPFLGFAQTGLNHPENKPYTEKRMNPTEIAYFKKHRSSFKLIQEDSDGCIYEQRGRSLKRAIKRRKKRLKNTF